MEIGITIIVVCVIAIAGLFVRLVQNKKKDSMTDKKENSWIKFVPSLNLPKERVSIAYDTHDERGVRYAYGYFQFYNGTCGCFWKDGNEQPKVIKAEDIKYWMPVPSLDVQEEPVSEQILSNVERVGKNWKEPVSDDFTKALAECIHNAQCNVVDPMVFAETWKDELIKLSKCEEPVSEDLEEAEERALEKYPLMADDDKEGLARKIVEIIDAQGDSNIETIATIEAFCTEKIEQNKK